MVELESGGRLPFERDCAIRVRRPSVAVCSRGPSFARRSSEASPAEPTSPGTEPEDVGSNFDGAPDLEFRLASRALELEQSGLSYQRIPPDYRSRTARDWLHRRRKIGEVYASFRRLRVTTAPRQHQ